MQSIDKGGENERIFFLVQWTFTMIEFMLVLDHFHNGMELLSVTD